MWWTGCRIPSAERRGKRAAFIRAGERAAGAVSLPLPSMVPLFSAKQKILRIGQKDGENVLTNAIFLVKYNVLLRARSYGEMAELVEGARLEIV